MSLKIYGTDGVLKSSTGGAGQSNTGSNIGTDGVGVFDQKVGADLQFRNLASLNPEFLDIALDAGDNDIDFTMLGSPTVKILAQKGSAGTINPGDVVYMSGFDSGDGVIEVELADSDNSSAMPSIGIAEDTIDQTTTGSVIVVGPATVNTTGESVGDGIYVDTTPGTWTTTRPTGTTTAIQRLGTISKIGASGTVFVAGALRSNDVPNLEDAKFWVGNASNVATAVSMGGEATMANDGTVTVADGADGTAIHDDVAGEIAAVTLKASPVSGDFILIEDSAAANAKKRITIGTLPAGGEINDLAGDGINGIADDQIAIGSGASTAAYHTLPNGAVSYATGTNTVSQAALANLSDVTGTTGTGSTVVFDTSPTIVTPTIASFVNATHNHEAAAGGNTLASAATPTAIHDDVASEISAVALKASPVSGDFLLIEDSAAGNAKKRITIGTLPAGGEINDLAGDGINGIADNQLAVGTGASTAGYQTLPTSQALAFNGTSFTHATWAQLNKATSDIADITTKSHTSLTDVGTNTHAQIDTHIALTNEHIDWTGAGAGTIHTDNYIEGGAGTDTTAIHDNTASEISAITVKASPVSGDFLLIEDSAAGNVKKHITVGSLPAGSEINDLAGDGISGIADNQLAVGTGAGTAAYATLSTAGAVAFNGTAFSQAASTDLSDTASIVLLTGSQTLTSKTLTAPIITTDQTLTTAGQITVDTTATDGQFVYYDAAEQVLTPHRWCGVPFTDPATLDENIMIMLEYDITIQEVKACGRGGTSVAWELRHSTDADSAGTLIEGNTTTTNGLVDSHTTLTSASVSAGEIIWVELDTVTGTVDDFTIQFRYRIDRS